MKAKNGFTLAELIISIIIISLSVLSMALIFQETLRGSPAVKAMTIATALAEEKIDEVLRLGYAGVNNTGPTNFPSPFSDYSFQIVVHYVDATGLDTSVDPLQTEYRNVEVRVMHSGIANISVNSLLANYTG